jgi:hypothetical protein
LDLDLVLKLKLKILNEVNKLNEVRSISVICLLFIIGKINACFVQFYRTVMFVFEILCSCVSEYVNPTKQRHSSDNPCHDVG